MESKPHLSVREIRILRNYGLVSVGIVVIYFLLGWIRAGAPVETAVPYRAEIAVLAPFTGESADNSKQIFDIVVQSRNYFFKELDLKNWEISVRGYDTGSTAQSFAWAAYLAARNPNTVAILGPLDARQIVAVRNTVLGKKLAIITTSSTAPVLNTSTAEGVYRISSTDDLQGPAIVSFLRSTLQTRVFLIIEQGAYTEKVLTSFTEAAKDRVRLVGSDKINPEKNDAAAIQQIASSNAQVVVYLGGSKGLELIIQELQKTGRDIPIIGVDSINDPKVASLLTNGQDLYFTSPIYVNTNIAGPYLELPADRENGPYSLQTVQATWFIMEALSHASEDGLGRITVWENLPDAVIRGLGGGRVSWEDGQAFPPSIYVYQGVDEEADWFYKPVYVFHP